jgi:cytochrome b6-f complex iron-sulfur subunit
MTCSSRRDFLKTLAGGAVAAALPEGCASSFGAAPLVDVGPYLQNGKLILAVGAYPELSAPGGAITATAPALPSPILIVNSLGSYYALSATCTHLGCPLGVDKGVVACPCHQSRFEPRTGAVLNPPAVANLPTYATAFDAATGALTVTYAQAVPAIVNGAVTYPLSDFPELQQCGSVYGTPPNGTTPILLAALPLGGYSAVNPICPHAGCIVGFSCTDARFECPCHGSQFDASGNLLQGPAPRGLSTYPLTATTTAVVVQVQ